MDVNYDRVRALFDQLVAAESENPPGDERAVAELCAHWLLDAGFEIRTIADQHERPNVVATLARGAGRRLILQGHMDTKPAVTPGTENLWETDPFRVTERDGRLHGLGACDTKGGLAAMLAAAIAAASDESWHGELVVQTVADEEDGSRYGAEFLLARRELSADAAIVSEPTSCRPSLAQLGNAWAEVTVVGVAAHAGRHEKGIDAFAAARRFLAELEKIVSEMPRHPAFPGHPRVNVGDVLVPGHPGTVPSEARLRCDVRVLPGQERNAVLKAYTLAAERISTENLRVHISHYQGGGCQSHQISTDYPIVESIRIAQRHTGQPLLDAQFFGGTDARYFAMAGTPAVVYGPGSLDQAHSPNEYVPADELNLAFEQLQVTVLDFLSPLASCK